MPITLQARLNSTRQGAQVIVDKSPDECPICHIAITPLDLGLTTQCNADGRLVIERTLLCPNTKCERVFIARYSHSSTAVPARSIPDHFALSDCVPRELTTKVQSPTISAISPDFCSIYAEADKAEQHNLTLVAGPGYRKALEFLIKDYVISQYVADDPAKVEAHRTLVEKQQLAACIKEHIKSDQIKQISKRAAWLGNDETHYVRKWDGKALDDLKKLISLTLHWIEMENLTAEVIRDMPE